MPTKWQPDFYYYLDAFLGAARSVPDVIQKCFGMDPLSKGKWKQAPDSDEIDRRNTFQAEFTILHSAFRGETLSRVRTSVYHWHGVAPVQAKARTALGRDYTGGPLEPIPSTACKELPLETDSAIAAMNKPLPVDPVWHDFNFEIPQADGTIRSIPLFDECRAYLRAAEKLVNEARELCVRIHDAGVLTPPPTISP